MISQMIRARDEKYIVLAHYISKAASLEPDEACKTLIPSLSTATQPLPSLYWDRQAEFVPLWVAVKNIDFAAKRIDFFYATEMELQDGVYVPKPPKVGTVRRFQDIFVNEGEGFCDPEAFQHIVLWYSLFRHKGPVFFQIISSTPANRKHTWLDAFCVTPESAISDARRQFHAGQGRRTDGGVK